MRDEIGQLNSLQNRAIDGRKDLRDECEECGKEGGIGLASGFWRSVKQERSKGRSKEM